MSNGKYNRIQCSIAKVYKITVQSLSGMLEEVYAAKETIKKWNEANAESAGKLYMLVDDAQSANVLLGIIGNRLENHELVDESLKDGKLVLLLFNEYADPKNTIVSEQNAVALFKESIRNRCIWFDYNGVSYFGSLIEKQLNEL